MAVHDNNETTRRVAFVVLPFIAFLIIIPLYDNLQQQAVMTSLVRWQRSTDAYSLRKLSSSHDNHTSIALSVDSDGTNDVFWEADGLSTDATATAANNNQQQVGLLPPPFLATNISKHVHRSFIEATNDDGIKLANLSSVDYMGCCGLGHRLARMANAAWVAKKLNFALHAYWGHCGKDTEVFQHLFGPQNKEMLRQVKSTNKHVRMRNEVNGFDSLKRAGPDRECWCQQAQIDAHREFYEDLRNRFRYKQQVDAFVNKTFANHVVLGMHIRAGNGEKGDFENKGRVIDDFDVWVKDVSKRIIELMEKEQWKESPLLYIATDTPKLIDMFRSELDGVMPVIDFPQERKPEGEGIYFGEKGRGHLQELECIRGWENAVMDMILLSYSDVLIAARMSSFAQTMPMSLVFGRGDQQKVRTPKCELNFDASKMICSETYLDWCCQVSQHDVRPEGVYPKEAVFVAYPDRELNMSRYQIKNRRYKDRASTKTYLPYYWKTRAMFYEH